MYGARPLRSTRRLQNLTGTLPKWWNITNKADMGAPSLVSIYDEIGMLGVSAGEFLAELAGVNGDLDVHINSPGGDVFDAIAIYNTLKGRKGTVSVTVDGLAASAASFIAQAASPGKLEMAPFAQMMIHDGFAMGIGNAADMRGLADQLDSASDNIAAIYAERTGKNAAYWRGKMKAETWYSDREAVGEGLADRVRGQQDLRNTWDLTVYNSDASDGAYGGGDGGKTVGDGWVCDGPGEHRFDPDGDGDDDSTPEGDTDHDYFDASGNQIKPVPPMPQHDCAVSNRLSGAASMRNADVDNSPWDASKAWHNGTTADDPEAFYRGICAGEKTTGDPATQEHWALPYKYTPSSPPNAAGVRNALGRLPQTHDLKNADQARKTLESAMKRINPDYQPDDHIDTGLLMAVLGYTPKGVSK